MAHLSVVRLSMVRLSMVRLARGRATAGFCGFRAIWPAADDEREGCLGRSDAIAGDPVADPAFG
jgi:hypothetical protein